MGWFFSLPPKPSGPFRRKKIVDGLWYRTVNDGEVLVEASPKFWDGYADDSPVSSESRAEFRRCKMNVRNCSNEGEAIALRTVLWNMDLFCPKCNGQATCDDDRCVHCRASLWQEPLTFQLKYVKD